MAAYEYKCASGHHYLVERPMSEPEGELTCITPECSDRLSRVWSSPAVIFRGRGFYKTGG